METCIGKVDLFFVGLYVSIFFFFPFSFQQVADIQIESSGKDTFVFETEHGVIQNLTMRQKGTGT